MSSRIRRGMRALSLASSVSATCSIVQHWGTRPAELLRKSRRGCLPPSTKVGAVESLDSLLDQLVTSCRILAAEGQGDMVWGHVSVRDPDGRGLWMKAAGLGLEEITRDDLVLIDREGTVLAGQRPRHSEFPIHTEVMAARPDTGCVVHTHARAPVAFAAVEEPL